MFGTLIGVKMSSELVPLQGVVVPCSMSSDALLGLSRSPLSAYALNLADIHQLVHERMRISALVVRVKDGLLLGVSRLLQFTSFNLDELPESVIERARMFGRHAPIDMYLHTSACLRIWQTTRLAWFVTH